MNDSMKTLAFVGTAAVVSILAFITYPSASTETAVTRKNGNLFENFTDPLAAKSIEIVSYDETMGSIETLKVQQNSEGKWVIPSKSDYPADAQNQLRDVANSLMSLTILDVATDLREEHELFGVVEPDADKVKAGAKNVGRMVKVGDSTGRSLAAIVIGKPERGNPKRRFVRIPNQDPVYVVELELEKIKTKFEDWIEKDLLKIEPTSIERVVIKDYSVVPTNVGMILDPRMEADLKFDNAANQWGVNEIVTFRRNPKSQAEPLRIPNTLTETEELNGEKLNNLKTALDALQIVDVLRKPKGLSAELKADQSLADNEESLASLSSAGFHFTTGGDIRSANGEVVVGLKDGVELVLRFGDITGRQDDASDVKLNRFLFAMARFDESRISAPDLEPEPQEPPVAPPAEKASPEAKSESGNGGACQDDKPAAADDAQGQGGPAPTKSDAGSAEAVAQENPDEPKTAVDAERERIKKSNEKKLADWRDRKKKAADKVADLNDRFADWYYVISEDTYKKIHLGRADIIREATKAKDEGFNVDAFRKLETEGLKK
ncbi:MAG: hypothetical protein RIS70_3046 [Planctomycetota bacterium]